MGAVSKTLTDATFEADVLQSDKPVLVDFWAEWCGPCRAVAPVLDEIARADHDEVTIVKLNTDENPATPASSGITSIPTMHVYQNGEIVKTIIGAMPKPKLLRELEPFLAPVRQLRRTGGAEPVVSQRVPRLSSCPDAAVRHRLTPGPDAVPLSSRGPRAGASRRGSVEVLHRGELHGEAALALPSAIVPASPAVRQGPPGRRARGAVAGARGAAGPCRRPRR